MGVGVEGSLKGSLKRSLGMYRALKEFLTFRVRI